MIRPFPKRPRLRLDQASYKILHERVLQRDGWRCQHCGCRSGLQVHHIRPRSLLGDDADENLITLCAQCHEQVHLRENAPTIADTAVCESVKELFEQHHDHSKLEVTSGRSFMVTEPSIALDRIAPRVNSKARLLSLSDRIRRCSVRRKS